MKENKGQLVPVLTTAAGSTLTLANWQETGIKTVAYYLESLLIKPGIAYLKTLPNLRAYTGWQGTIVLNASLNAAVYDNGIYKLHSPYDGSLIKLTTAELFTLIQTLQPDIVILPLGFAAKADIDQFSPTITCYIPLDEHLLPTERPSLSYYLSFDNSRPFNDFMQIIKENNALLNYVMGEFNLAQCIELSTYKIFIESDKPAKDAVAGKIFHLNSVLNIQDELMANQHTVLDKNCSCPGCSQKLTRAYLHYLFTQVPLLCQRFLIQHNIEEIISTSFT